MPGQGRSPERCNLGECGLPSSGDLRVQHERRKLTGEEQTLRKY